MQKFDLVKVDEHNLSLVGELSFATANKVVEELVNILPSFSGEIYCELNLTRSDSSAIAVMLQAVQLTAENNIKLFFLQVPDNLLRLIRSFELERILPLA